MGGKNKQSQRTKNNVRPSSSGRSAELLSSAGKFDSTMTTIGGKLMPALFPTLAAVTLDAGLDPELAMCIKKLNKKDPITKTKALQELTELVNKSNVDDVVAALPGWSHFYKTLSVDADCKVRECTQACHGAVVRVCGRRVAPHLKQLLPAWLQAQYDDHAPAQSQAQLSLKNTFPDAKLPEVIAFCKTEILDFLEDNLTGKSALAAAAAEEEGGRGNAAALHGLAWSCRHAPPSLDEWLWARAAGLLADDAFWRLATHKEGAVRGAWFGALGSVVERFAARLDARRGARALRALLRDEREPRARAQLWGCLLLVMHAAPEWQKWLDKKDLLAKRILNLLETGGWGDARQLSRMLLPLLASLPPDMLTDTYYEEFFDAIFKGLEKKSLMNSPLERQAWTSGLAECVRYAARSARAPAAAALRRWLRAALAAPGLLRHSAGCFTDLLYFWMRKSSEADGDSYAMLVRNFWQSIAASLPGAGEPGAASAERAAASARSHEQLLSALRASATNGPKAKRSIRFDGDSPAEIEPASPVTPPEPADVELFHHHLCAVTEQVCARYIEIARDTKSPSVILPTIHPLLDFLPKSSIEAISQYLDAKSVYGLFETVLLPWLRDDETRCEAAADAAFVLLAHMADEEQGAALAAFTQDEVCKWALARCLSHAHVRRPAARRWLRGAAVRRVLAAAARRLAPGDTTLLLMALTPDDHDEMLVSPETVCEAVRALVATRARAAECGADGAGECGAGERGAGECGAGERSARALARLATTLAPRPPDNYTELLLAVFNINLTTQRGSPDLSVESWLEARSSWQDGLQSLATQPRMELRAEAARLLLAAVLPDTTLEDVKISTVEHATSLCPYLLTECEQETPSSTDEVVQLIDQLFERASKHLEGSQSLDVFALRHDCIVSKLSCPFGDDNEAIQRVVQDCDRDDVEELEKGDLVLRLTELLFRTLSLRTLLLHRPDIDDVSEDKEQTWCGVLLRDERLQAEFCRLLRDYLVVHSLHEGYTFWPHYEIIDRTKQKLDVSIQDIIAETPASLRQQILLSLSERAAKEGYYWAYARSFYEAKSLDRSGHQSADVLEAANVDLDNLSEVLTGNGLYHSLQANLRWLPAAAPPAPASPALRTAHLVMLRAALAALEAEQAPSDVREQFANDAVAAAQAGAEPDVMVDLYYKFEKVVVGEREPSSVSWASAVCTAATADYLALLVAERGWAAAAHHWDFATISLCAMLAALANLHSIKTALLCESALRLLRSVRTFVAALPAECERRQPAAHVAALIDEWRDIFSPDIHTTLFNVVLKVLDSPAAGPLTCHRARALSALTGAARGLQWAALPGALRAGALSLQRVAARGAAALARAAHRGYKYLAHATLTALAADLVLEDAEKLSAWSERSSEEARAPPALSVAYFHEAYSGLLELLDIALHNIQVGEATCEMCCESDARGVALGALLLADALHAAGARARGDLTHHYIQIYREEKYTDLLLPCAVRLLPADVFAFAADNAGDQLPDRLVDLFVNSPQFSLDEAEWSCCGGAGDVGALACRAVLGALAGPGQAAARAVWAAWTPRASRLLCRLTAAAVAPALLQQQFARAAKRARALPDTTLTLLPAAREAHAVHTVEDQPLRLTITFARTHPLAPPRVQPPAAGPAARAHWLAVYLGYQNGDLWTGVSLWVTSLSARIERAPQCYICYCRLQPGEGVLPKVFCNQCRNKFHTACLRKWFTTSKKSNCPVCRAMF